MLELLLLVLSMVVLLRAFFQLKVGLAERKHVFGRKLYWWKLFITLGSKESQ